jgi:hypothetical protein
MRPSQTPSQDGNGAGHTRKEGGMRHTATLFFLAVVALMVVLSTSRA